jgi:two-component sensor histidine kinase
VKNNLQIILAMVDMRIEADGEMVPLTEFQRLGSHIRTIAAVHDLLTRAARDEGQTETIPVKDVLEQLLPIHQETAPRTRIDAVINDVDLPGRKGTSLALVVNELVSNAIKHGRGHVKLLVTTVNSHVEVTVCDNGSGFPEDFDPAKAANTGLELVNNLVRWDLSGRVTFGNQPQGGGQVSVTVPIDHQ